MNLNDCLLKTLSIIEERRTDKLSVQELAAEAHHSSAHLQKVFRLTTGQSLMDYVRGRKLAYSLDDLLYTNLRVIDIAGKYGFEHEQSYIRAFCTEYGCTPGKARKNKLILPIRPRIAPEDLIAVGQGVLYKPYVVIVPPFCIVGKKFLLERFDRIKHAMEPNRLAKQFFYEGRGDIKNIVDPDVYIGLVNKLEEDNVEYIPSAMVSDLSYVPEGYVGREISVHSSVCFRYIGEHSYEEISMETARDTYAAIDHYFSKQSRYTRNTTFSFERIESRMYDGTYCQMELYYPVEDSYHRSEG